MNPRLLFLFLALLPLTSSADETLKGSPEARARENTMADELGLERIADEQALRQLVVEKRLVPIPNNANICWHQRLPTRLAFCLPHAREFLLELGKDFRDAFGKPITVTSAVRPISYQEKLAKRNRNAAPTEGLFASTHPTGATLDIGYKKLRLEERTWLEAYLSKREAAGEIQATKERYQACFHVMVYMPKERIASIEKSVAR